MQRDCYRFSKDNFVVAMPFIAVHRASYRFDKVSPRKSESRFHTCGFFHKLAITRLRPLRRIGRQPDNGRCRHNNVLCFTTREAYHGCGFHRAPKHKDCGIINQIESMSPLWRPIWLLIHLSLLEARRCVRCETSHLLSRTIYLHSSPR